ncbi:putative mucin TcMUCII [Trypanosoma cruzi]|uniref:Mucin TcMUCII, putative n=2 Tax=Trypanosoma cruzi TaxID=5693 RepID=Q4E2B0_TRYCC|nr:mucin TcMUCII, putative [Trypanosoma cruzi]EAN98915.1 mucin TcMUCII, putative [Trypanosoma cruzi]PWV17685.1 putative mucin TcMUCII [Trypanosoma cruzi]RNC55299.1 mucin TcMUCII [Trypanosoma cruzi]|eukprot:XP_820766.1 mucin TcMUCII [Trypanosoma cruzi strain CL Brener]
MMTMCRLLCALLVLALCCCPSVCAEETQKTQGEADGSGVRTPPPPPEPSTTTTTGNPKLPVSESAREDTGHSGSSSSGPVKGQETPAEGEKSSKSTVMQSDEKTNTAQTDGTAGTKSDTSTTAGKAGRNAESSANTTTTTTTQAPSTTTTEAPTTTTTRAPSHLREIDGSLSSSAWVCAPLLLAVSALAYTAVG